MNTLSIILCIYLASAVVVRLWWSKIYNSDPKYFDHPIFNFDAVMDIACLIPVLNTFLLGVIVYESIASRIRAWLKLRRVMRELNNMARKYGHRNLKEWAEAAKPKDEEPT
jgi:hypothetical protein